MTGPALPDLDAFEDDDGGAAAGGGGPSQATGYGRPNHGSGAAAPAPGAGGAVDDLASALQRLWLANAPPGAGGEAAPEAAYLKVGGGAAGGGGGKPHMSASFMQQCVACGVHLPASPASWVLRKGGRFRQVFLLLQARGPRSKQPVAMCQQQP